MRRLIPAFALATLLAPSAFAQGLLIAADPAAGSTSAEAPRNLKLTFSEPVEAASSHVDVNDTLGAQVDFGTLKRDPASPKRLLVPLQPLAPGVYIVHWQATTTDRHQDHGTFRFTIVP